MGPINKTPIKDTLNTHIKDTLKNIYYGAYKRHLNKTY